MLRKKKVSANRHVETKRVLLKCIQAPIRISRYVQRTVDIALVDNFL
jgi:hypothetical protein